MLKKLAQFFLALFVAFFLVGAPALADDKQNGTAPPKEGTPKEGAPAEGCPVPKTPENSNAKELGIKICSPVLCFKVEYQVQPGTARITKLESWDINNNRWKRVNPAPGAWAWQDALNRLSNPPTESSLCAQDCSCNDWGVATQWAPWKQNAPIFVDYTLPGVLGPPPRFKVTGTGTLRWRLKPGMCIKNP